MESVPTLDSTEPSLPLKLAKALLATAAGLVASEMAKKAFDKVVESRHEQTIEDN